MELTTCALWLAIALVIVNAIVTKTATGRIIFHPVCARRLPPVVNITALLGLVPTLCTKGLNASIQKLYAKFGSVFTVSLFRLKLTFLIGQEVSTHFFEGSDSEVYNKFALKFVDPMFGGAIGSAVPVTTQIEQRSFFRVPVQHLKLRSYFDAMLQEVEGYFSKWGQDGSVDLKHELEHVLTLFTCRCLLGIEVREKNFDEFKKLFSDVEQALNYSSILFPYAPTPTNRRRDRARIRVTEMLCEVVRSRRSSGRVEEDALQILINSKYKDGRSTTPEEVAGLAMVQVFAGKHTSTHAATWTGAYLLSQAKILAAVQEEQKQTIGKHTDRMDYSGLLCMETLQNCIKEALRLHPAVPMIVRNARKQYTVQMKQGSQYDIPEGHTLVSPVVLNNNLPHIYKDPQVYDPYRFGLKREEDKSGGKFSYTSFGGGRRACPGEAYAYMQIKLIWAYLLRNFDLTLTSPFPEADSTMFVPNPKGKLMVSYKRRKLLTT